MLNLEKGRVIASWAVWTALYIVVAGIIVPAKFAGEIRWTVLLAVGAGFLLMAFAGGGFFARGFKGEVMAAGLGVGLHQTVFLACAALAIMPENVGGGIFSEAAAVACALAAWWLLIGDAGYPPVYWGLTLAGLVGTIGGIAIGWPVATFMATVALIGGLGLASKKNLARAAARW